MSGNMLVATTGHASIAIQVRQDLEMTSKYKRQQNRSKAMKKATKKAYAKAADADAKAGKPRKSVRSLPTATETNRRSH